MGNQRRVFRAVCHDHEEGNAGASPKKNRCAYHLQEEENLGVDVNCAAVPL